MLRVQRGRGVPLRTRAGPTPFLSAGRLRDGPSLSVQPGPSVALGETVTLLCQSGDRTDTFLLSQEGAAHRPLRLRAQDQGGRFQAEFSLGPVSSAHGGTYRCYRALSTEPHLLSRPSEPLALLVSGEARLSVYSTAGALPWEAPEVVEEGVLREGPLREGPRSPSLPLPDALGSRRGRGAVGGSRGGHRPVQGRGE